MNRHNSNYEKPLNFIVFNDTTACHIITSITLASIFLYLGYRKVRKDIRSLEKKLNDLELVDMA